jgi:two-component system, OmpR family, sensor histidine kinase KdpD
MSGPEKPEISYLRSEDLLDETPPERLARSFGLSRRRQLTGGLIALIGLPLLTLAIDALGGRLDLDAEVLLYLLAVVAIAVVGGVVVAVVSAVAAGLLINYFFVEPVHTLTVGDADQVVTLAVFVVVAILVSGAYELAVRRAQAAERARDEAETLAALAGPKLDEEGSLHEVLDRARETFRMESVALLARARGAGEWAEADHAGWAPRGSEAPLRFDVPVGHNIRLVGRGPAMFAEDDRVLNAFARAAATAYEGQMLSGEAEEARALATVDEQRTALLAAVGHDLRTPLAGIKAAVSSLRQSDVEWSAEDRDALLATIEESADRLETVVTNLLDASRLQAGALGVKVEAVALDDVVAGALIAVPGAAERVEVDVPEDLPPVRADRGLLERVLANLIGNALTHGASERPVEIRALTGGQSARLEVTDHGRGVPPGLEARLFEPFQRLDDRGPKGLGLGLSVSRGFVEAMGGAMVADRTPGGGLTMRIRLELAPVPDSAPTA